LCSSDCAEQKESRDPQITQIAQIVSEKMTPVKSANLLNLRIKTVRCFGCGPQVALRNLRIDKGPLVFCFICGCRHISRGA